MTKPPNELDHNYNAGTESVGGVSTGSDELSPNPLHQSMFAKPLSERIEAASIEEMPELLEELYYAIHPKPKFLETVEGNKHKITDEFGHWLAAKSEFDHHLTYQSGYLSAAAMLIENGWHWNWDGQICAAEYYKKGTMGTDCYVVQNDHPAIALAAAIAKSLED